MLCLTTLGTLPSALADPATPRWTQMGATVFKHMPAPLTNSMAQDRRGFMWLGTQSGLIRWDGYTSRLYTADSKRPRALPDSFVPAVHVDSRGNLWIGTSSGGMARYDPASDGFTVISAGPGGVSDAHVAAFADDGVGGLWIGTASGLDHMDTSGKVTALSDTALPPSGRGSAIRTIEALLRDQAGGLWIGTRKGLLYRAPNAAAATAYGLDAPISVLLQDTSGRIWIGTRDRGAFVIRAGEHGAVSVGESGPNAALHKQRVCAIVEVAPREIWFGTEGGGIVALDPDGGVTRRIRHTPDAPDSLSDNDTYALFRERSGLIMVGSTDASSVHDPRPRAVVTIRDTGLPMDGKFTAPSILVRPDGKVWVGVGGGGIDIIDPAAGDVGQIAAGEPGGLPTGRVLTMANGPDGNVYAGTQQGLYRIDAQGERVEQMRIPGRSATAASWAVAFQDGVTWLGGLDGLWALKLDATGASATVLRHEDGKLGDSRVTSLLALANGGLWIGTRAGLVFLPSAEGSLEVIPTDAATGDRLPRGFTSSLALDQQGRLWSSTFGRGVQVLERTDADGRRRFRRIERTHGLPDNSVNVVLADRQGAMWASTDKGLARIDTATLAVKALSVADGVHITQYWSNSAALTDQGELLFGGITGLTVLRPDKLADIDYRAPVVVTDLAVADQPVAPGRYIREPDVPAAAALEITPAGKERGFSLEFAALDYSASERAQYAYRLVGFDSGWIPTAPGSRRLGYTNLPPGHYTLQLRAATRAGAWTEPLSLPVHALRSWHQMAWVRALAVLLALGAVAWLVRLRIAWYRSRQAELESMVEQRTSELRASQVMLEQLAYADVLTGLPNRRLFNDELRHMRAQAARDRSQFTLLLIDLDHFKQVNDTLGHDAGDALLIEVARRLRLCVRETDRLARLGGDEFAVLLGNTGDEHDVDHVARRIVDSVGQPIAFGEHQMRVGASIGVATFQGTQASDEALYKQADLALYQAKSAGRNTWVWYRAEKHEEFVST
ncbi:ligand-binding sensor domain-containing diguanylate cyclase [Pseudoduganella namucuonensis]|uniref:Diguanylate cyclase (GGDEF) domain-containing protein n=1 Tax=Pseudoduganella namucuonensis TaxID=1035707 RepID=A0A1I7LTB2_9BURK|nr:ligand-binding sensor domain-containing diguanylate cyclase [Pseudoduganella namucuonensis]SFV12878.1 diguanylate cyclase (GGDEF) domain-containing protein [Pseudoduganella namucuonensis]